jgi:predicted TIM-barrel fold metal-dependent hydrolase
LSAKASAAIREQLSHPVIDIDGHTTESMVALESYFRAEGVDPQSPSLRRVNPGLFGPPANWYDLTPEERIDKRVSRPPWWGAPASNTRDLATALSPKLMYDRLDEFGIDFSVTYPSLGLVFMHLEDEKERRGTCRALNQFNAESFDGLGDRMTPVAAIPMHHPDQAIEDLEYAVGTLGFKTVLLAGYVQRPVPEVARRAPELAQYAQWIDMYGLDSAYDYDPVWAKCIELGVGVSFHSGSIGWGSRLSISNYMYNHLGHLAEGHHALAKSLFMGGVTRRFPQLPFAFLEGGVAWAVTLYSDLIGHWEKRNGAAMQRLNPANIDVPLLAELLDQYGSGAGTNPGSRPAARAQEDPATIDEFAACGITSKEDIRDLFVPNFFFGCEADDPLTATAFNTKLNPYGARLQAMFGSDLSHWDVPDMTEVLEEAWEMVDHEWITDEDFRHFMFTHPVNFFTRTNPRFFAGTSVEAAVDAYLAQHENPNPEN